MDGADAARIVELADRAVATASSDTERMAHTNTYAAALYRAGRYDEARIWLLESVAARAGGFLEDWLFLALTEQRLGHAAEARDWLEKSKTWLANPPEKYPRSRIRPNAGPVRGDGPAFRRTRLPVKIRGVPLKEPDGRSGLTSRHARYIPLICWKKTV